MLTRTLPSPEKIIEETPEFIEEKVDERGFYLYEWISPDELRMSVKADYLGIIRASSIPLAIITLIAGFLGFSGGIPGVILAVIGVLGIFYSMVLGILIIKMIRKSYLYTRWADVVITDKHYVSNGKVVERTDFRAQKEAFEVLEKTFREPLLEPSGLSEHIEMQKSSLMDELKTIASGWWRLVQNLGRSRDAGGIIVVLMIAGVLYGGMMAGVYFIWVFFVSTLARVFSWFSHRMLIAANNKEHTIQTLFWKINNSSFDLQEAAHSSSKLLTEAGRNDWAKNLSKRLSDSFEVIGELAGNATTDTVKLRKILESSKYKDIFNFVKYGSWVKSQILHPIEEILLLLEKNSVILERTIKELDSQIENTDSPALKSPLKAQKTRLEIQRESFHTVIWMLEGYQAKLN